MIVAIQAVDHYDFRFVLVDSGTNQVGKLAGHTLAVMNVAFSPRDELIATSSADNTVRIWDGKKFALRTEMRGEFSAVRQHFPSIDVRLAKIDDRLVKMDDEFGKLRKEIRSASN